MRLIASLTPGGTAWGQLLTPRNKAYVLKLILSAQLPKLLKSGQGRRGPRKLRIQPLGTGRECYRSLSIRRFTRECDGLRCCWCFSLRRPCAAQSQERNGFPSPADVSLPQISAVPIFSAGLAYNTFIQGGTANLHPLVSPVILIPFGQNWLIESRDTFEINLAPVPGENGYKGYLQKEVDYLQLDYIASPYFQRSRLKAGS